MRKLKIASVLGFLFVLALVPIITMQTNALTIKSDYTKEEKEILEIIEEPKAAIEYSPDGKGYLNSIGSPNKYLLHVEGTPYQMGYQHGWLRAQAVKFLASSASFKQILLAFCGLTSMEEARQMLQQVLSGTVVGKVLAWLLGQNYIDQLFRTFSDILDVVVQLVRSIVNYNLQFVPQELKDEMKGIADGATARGYATSLSDVYLLNLGFDALLSFIYPIATPFMQISQWMSWHACDGFVATGSATADGRTIMGRNWMFTAYGLKDYSLIIEQKPNSGNKFINVAIPGIVGVIAGMNTKGIGIGMDMIPAWDCDPGHFGMGAPFLARMALQYKNEYADAYYYIGNSHHGVSWLYIVGDGKGTNTGGCIVERSASWWFGREDDYEVWWPYAPLYDMREHKSNLVVVANSYGHPLQNIGAQGVVLPDSVWRYTVVADKCLAKYGTMTPTDAKAIVDYAHPPNYNYYNPDPNGPIEGIRTVFDLTNLKVYSLYGYYNHPWVTYQLTA